MNKELIKKYKKEFDYWLNGGNLLCTDWRNNSKNWIDADADGDDFTYIGPKPPIFIKNDKYVKFRKALAEGKTVLYKFGVWTDGSKRYLSITKAHRFSDFSYYVLEDSGFQFEKVGERAYRRITKFKVGDWLHSDLEPPFKIIHEKQLIAILKRTDDYNLRLWQPQLNEWCIFYSENAESFRVAKYKEKGIGKGKEGLYKDMQGNYFKYCEPYLGELPTILKDR